MEGRHGSGSGGFDALARDWITLWQSELAGMAFDREVQETWQTAADTWAAAAITMLELCKRGQPEMGPTGSDEQVPRTAHAARTAPAAAASGTGDEKAERERERAELERLRAQLNSVELRLDGLERSRPR